MNITVLSRAEFKKLVETISTEEMGKTAFISIHDPSGPNSTHIIEGDNVLNLHFDDIEYIPKSKDIFMRHIIPFNDEMADQIISFANKNKDKDNFVIHCTFGKCRSGAVGDALSTYFEIPYFDFKRKNPRVQPNSLVRSILINKIT